MITLLLLQTKQKKIQSHLENLKKNLAVYSSNYQNLIIWRVFDIYILTEALITAIWGTSVMHLLLKAL